MPLEMAVLGIAVVFCRIAGCLMTLPGFGSERIPVRVRLFIAIAVTMALGPVLWDAAEKRIATAPIEVAAAAVVTETIIGVLIGLSCRMFMFALETMTTGVAQSIGLSGALGVSLEHAEPLPTLASFAVLGATTLVFVLDQHWELIRGLRQSYEVIPLFETPDPRALLAELARTLDRSYLVLFRISSPFLLFGLTSNLAVGFLNRMVPQAPIYFVSTPLLIILGVYWFYALAPDFFATFSMDFGGWIDKG